MIHRIRIQNFRSIIDVTVDLSPVTVLVGRSGAGKSNFVQAVRFLRDVLTAPQTAQVQQEWERSRPATAPDGPAQFEIHFSIAGVEDAFQYQLSIAEQGFRQGRPLEERLNLGGTCLFHQALKNAQDRHLPPWLVEPEVIPVPQAGPIALGRIPSISEVVIAFTALTSGIGCYLFSDGVLCGGQQSQAATGLDDSATNYLETLKEIITNLHDLRVRKSMVAALQRINPSVSSVELNDVRQPSHVVVGHKFNGKTLPLQLSQESAGFRRFYAHLLALYQQPSKQTLLFEHPEDGIHPGALSLLAEEFNAAPGDGRGQVILTTHSPEFLDHFAAEQIRVVELDGLQTRIGLVSDEQRDAIRERLLDAGELLTVDPARIQLEATEA
ncbi:MAG: AAA family ATPase [Thermoguttaceae bacterium]|nr:AAA family ATPase [Thermoguttaceae bacterium]